MGNTDFVNILNYLEESHCITQQESNALKGEIVRDKGLDVFCLVALFADSNWAGSFISSLPISFNETLKKSGQLDFTNFIATDFAWSRVQGRKGWKAIESISFKVAPLQGMLTWVFPFGNSSPSQKSKSYQLTHDQAIDISIDWPAYSQRSVEGSYRGVLKVGVDRYHLVGKLSMVYEGTPQYRMSFSDEYYSVDNYTAPISVALSIFNATTFPLSKLLQTLNINGLNNTMKTLGDTLPLKDVGFVLEKSLSKVLLGEIFGMLPLTDNPSTEWWPFKKTNLSIDGLRIVLRGIDTPISREVIIQLNGNMNDFHPAVPLRLSAGLSGKNMTFEIAMMPDLSQAGLSIQQILDITNMSPVLDVSKTFPALSNLSNAFHVSNASLGWDKKGINFARLGIDIQEWTVLPGKFVVTDLSFDIYATWPTKSKTFSLWGSGAMQIGDIDLAVAFDIERQQVSFQLLTLESPLTLKSIFGHFLGEGEIVLPSGLVSLLEETGIETVIVEGLHDNGSWSLSRFALSVSVTKEIKISDKFKLLFPRFDVNVEYPFVKAQRTIDASISATIEIAETPCDTSVTWAGQSSSLTVAFEPIGKPLLLHAVISLLIPNGNTSIAIPDSLSFLTGIGLAKAKLVFSSKGGFKLNEVSAAIISSSSLQLWAGLELKDLKLIFNYSNVPGSETKSVIFGATFLIAKANLDFSISYIGPGSQLMTSEIPAAFASSTATTNKNGTWDATATYDGTISTLEIMSSVSGVDMSKELSLVGLSALREVIDITLSDLKLKLARSSDQTSFTFDAHVKYLFFDGPVHLMCSRTTSWIYSFTFILSSEKFLSDLGIDVIQLKDSSISLSNAPASPASTSLVNTATPGGINLSFSGTLIFTGPLQNLAKVTGNPSLTITGSVSSSAFTLAAAANKIPVFNGMILTGSLFLSYVVDSKQLVAAIQGVVDNISFPQISSEKFCTTFSLFVKLPNPELGFQFTVDKLENAFSIKGLHFRDILFRAAFQEFPVPSEIAIAGKLSFHIGSQQFYGSIAIYYSEVDLTHCGSMGKFETYPSLNDAIKGFDSQGRTGPKAVNGTFSDLEFSRALQEVRVGNIVIPQGFIMKGSLKLPTINLDTSFYIEISPKRIRISGDIKNAVTVTVKNNRLFALTRADDRKRGPTMDLDIETNAPPKCYFSGEIYLLGLTASAQFELNDTGMEFHETISAWKAGFKVDFAINYSYYLDLSATGTLDLTIPTFNVGIVPIPKVRVAKFAASFVTKVDWEPITWNLTALGTVTLAHWDVGQVGPFMLSADLSDFDQIAKYVAEQIKDVLSSLFKNNILDKLKEGVESAVKELKEVGVEAAKTAELLVKEFHRDVDEVSKVVGQVFDLGKDEVAKIMKDLGSTAEKVGRFLKDTYSMSEKEVVSLLKQVGYAADDVAR